MPLTNFQLVSNRAFSNAVGTWDSSEDPLPFSSSSLPPHAVKAASMATAVITRQSLCLIVLMVVIVFLVKCFIVVDKSQKASTGRQRPHGCVYRAAPCVRLLPHSPAAALVVFFLVLVSRSCTSWRSAPWSFSRKVLLMRHCTLMRFTLEPLHSFSVAEPSPVAVT